MRSSPRPASPFPAALLLLLPPFALALAACSDEYGTRRTHSAIAADPLALDFGQRDSGESASLPLTVSNTGSTTLHVSRSYVRNDTRSAFSAQALPAEVAAGASVTVELTYRAPDAEGPDGAQFVIESDADNAPEYVVSLTGRSADQCLLGQRLCDGACVDTAADSNHCGDCTTVCQAPQKCLQGQCGCEAKTCATSACGDTEDGCGQTLRCGECTSPQVCIDLRCLAPTCTDHLEDGEETDVDCGGQCSPCALGKGCATLADCEAGLACIEKVCSHCRTIADCPTDQVCRDGICGACLSRDECGGERACLGGRCLSCPDEASYNECGLCGGAPVSWVGATCVGASGCEAKYVCNAQLVGVECPTIAKDACGLCGGTATGIGTDCTDPDSGCPSKWECVGTVKTCKPVAKDVCGACGGTTTEADLGKICFDTDTGCESKWACVGTVKTCPAVAMNACGLCGGPAITDLPRTDCTSAAGCTGKFECSTDLKTTSCNAPPMNACGLCGGPTITDLPKAGCTNADGCTGEFECSTDLKTTSCNAPAANACGLCGGPAITDLPNTDCTNTAGCTGKWRCSADNKTTTCDAPASCTTTLANHVVISQICGEGPSFDDDFVELYNPTNAAIDVSGYRLFYRKYSNTTTWTNYVDVTGTIPAHSYRLVAHSTSASYSSLADVVNANFNVGADGGQLLLWKARTALGSMVAQPPSGDPNYVDYVGWGNAARWEGSVATAPGTGGVIVRKAKPTSTSATMVSTGTDGLAGNGIDTDFNGNDFVRLTEFAPRNSATPPRP